MTSVLTKSQKKQFRKSYTEGGQEYLIIATVRYDDECGNGHNTFSITGEVWRARKGQAIGRDFESGGCIHDAIAKHFPELAPLLKWHLCASDGPMNYVGNTVYMAGDRDYNGLRKDEFRPFQPKADGTRWWKAKKMPKRGVLSVEKPAAVLVEYELDGIIGEGKARELDKARHAAIWPEATDEELTAPGLEERLKARLPQLMAEFRMAVESLGFVY
jgi:hypothetical protein